ncbi:DMT family transporter [Thalassospiraceae bacterium LMO-JJ14]|nr:DMT family transporter [Thalassospiraceae bacterium LMO-JJ14]
MAARDARTVKATLIGSTAVLMWGLLALFTTLTGKIPPFQLAAMSFGIATAFVAIKWLVFRENIVRHLKQPIGAWALGTCGLFGYHFFYFMALKNAPPVEAGLIAYMWPLLIVVGSALLPGERLRWWHVAGAFAGLVGAALLITGGRGLAGFKSEFTLGYAMAVLCALTWSSYSVFNRRFGHVPTDTVGGFCAATAVLALLCHGVFEQTVWPADGLEWLGVIGLGLGPVGAAFFTWDYGTKHGDIQVLGALAYAAPLISTILLIAFGKGEATWVAAAGCLLIVGGAVLASKELLKRKPV